MKRTLTALILVCLLAALPGCGGGKQDEPAGLEPMPVRQKDPVDMGRVLIVSGGYWSVPELVDEARSDQILELVCEQIKRQRNITMDLQIAREENFSHSVIARAAAGDPPEILVRVFNDRSSELMPDPLRLNEAIDGYGPNLGRIPESCWALSRIGDSVMSIPAVGMYFETIAANKDVLDSYGWAVPASPDQFEQLLAEARAAGLRPIDGFSVQMFWPWFGIQSRADYPSLMLEKDKDGKLISVYQSLEYEQCLQTMRRWVEQGYISTEEGSDGNWLFRSMGTPALASTPNAVPIRPLPLAPGGPATAPSLQIKYCFESFNKPEALVTLMDWAYASGENHALIAMGEQGKDYETIGDSGYRFIDGYKWEFQEYLSMGGFGGNPIRDCENPDAVRQAAADNDVFAKPDLYLTLPPVTWRYALPKSNLLKAWEDLAAYSQAMQDAAYQYVGGQIARVDYDKLAEASQPLMDGCIKTVQRYLDKVDDPAKEMYAAAGEMGQN